MLSTADNSVAMLPEENFHSLALTSNAGPTTNTAASRPGIQNLFLLHFSNVIQALSLLIKPKNYLQPDTSQQEIMLLLVNDLRSDQTLSDGVEVPRKLQAYEIVKKHFIRPDKVPVIMTVLKMLFGRQEFI